MSVVADDPTRAARLAAAQEAAGRVHHPDRAEPVGTAYAGLVTRTLAFAIDAGLINLVALAVGAVAALVVSILPGSGDLGPLAVAAGGAAFGVWIVAYFVTFWATTGETPGNRAMGIRVVRADGRPMRPRHALLRLVGIVLSLPFLAGFVPILFNARRRGLHDVLAGTVVRVTGGGSTV